MKNPELFFLRLGLVGAIAAVTAVPALHEAVAWDPGKNKIPPITRALGDYPSTFNQRSPTDIDNFFGRYGNYSVESRIDAWTPGRDIYPRVLYDRVAQPGDYLYPTLFLRQREEPADNILQQVRTKGRVWTVGSVIVAVCDFLQEDEDCPVGTDMTVENMIFNVNFPHARLYYAFSPINRVRVVEGMGGVNFDLELDDAANGYQLFGGTINVRIPPIMNNRIYLPSLQK